MTIAKQFYVTYRKDEKGVRRGGVLLQTDKEESRKFLNEVIADAKPESTPKTEVTRKAADTETDRFDELIIEVFEIFLALYETIPNIRSFSSLMPKIILEDQLKKIVKETAVDVESLDSGELFTLPVTAYDKVTRLLKVHDSIQKTNQYIDRFFILGLISLYDQFIRTLAQHVIAIRPHCLLGQERTIKISDVLNYKTIEEVKYACIDRELDRLLHESHLEQFKWFEEKLDLKIDPASDLKTRFTELCERRNLFAHTGGRVSQQYLDECRKVNYDLKDIKCGDELKSTRKYFATAVETVIELATQLVHVIWQKTDKKGSTGAARSLINITFNLIRDGKYDLAIKLIEFILDNRTTQNKLDIETKRIHLINHANALKLAEKPDYLKRVDVEDWSSMTLKEELCLAAVRGEDEKFLKLLPKAIAAEEIFAQDFRTWPVFEPLRKSEKYVTLIQEIFKEPIVEVVSKPTK
ncbi:MAG: hypothetical protein M3O03_05960 [Pseudomonadota bacterium]|nr:hypothetical protein [Pseudomonadota bacterium]